MSFKEELQKFLGKVVIAVPSEEQDAFTASFLAEAQYIDDCLAAIAPTGVPKPVATIASAPETPGTIQPLEAEASPVADAPSTDGAA